MVDQWSSAPTAAAPRLVILGTRGIPAAHGGFETFAERLALHLVARGWAVTVACQADDAGPHPPAWQGVALRHHRPRSRGPLGTIEMDFRAILGTLRRADLALTLGYNTAVFGVLLRAAGIPHLMNMDGIEWRRAKWSAPVRGWFWLNERAARFAADHLVADHPQIAAHLARHTPAARITTIPYGADVVAAADPALLVPLGLAGGGAAGGGHVLAIARVEPENSVLEIVQGFSARPRGLPLVVLGRLEPARHPYHAAIRAAASAEVRFPGAIYDPAVVAALRLHARLHVHGHRVGGTNPSLVEALGAGNPVLAHDNPFNRWVAGPAMTYFRDAADCAAAFDRLLAPGADLRPMSEAARARHAEAFRWPDVLTAYEALLASWLRPGVAPPLPGAP